MYSGKGAFQMKFLHSVAAGASVEETAAIAISTWRDVDAALAPIIGQAGVAALLRRSQYLVRVAHPWLGAFQQDLPATPAFEALHTALLSQPAGESAQGNAALLEVFHDLLVSLIGESLCERLLRPVYPSTPSGTAAQDPSP